MTETTMTKEDALKLYLEKTARFNIFKVLGMQKGSENRHSNFLAWLLNPNESHNLKTQFLYKFLKSLSINADKYDLDNVSITREDSNEFGRPDIIIENDEFMCLVEVKFGAKETNYQCKRYYNYYKNLDKVKYFIFLDIDDECYDKLKKKTGYMNDDTDEFNFSENYRLATFKNNILYILKELTSNIHSTDNNLVGVLNQYIDVLEEKYALRGELKNICLKMHKMGNYDKDKYEDLINKMLAHRRWEIIDAIKNILSEKYYLPKQNTVYRVVFAMDKTAFESGNYYLFNNVGTINNSEIQLFKSSFIYPSGQNQKMDQIDIISEDTYNELFYEEYDKMKELLNIELERILANI